VPLEINDRLHKVVVWHRPKSTTCQWIYFVLQQTPHLFANFYKSKAYLLRKAIKARVASSPFVLVEFVSSN